MGKVYDGITPELSQWIGRQHLFFVATAPLAGDGLINCSPKGMDTFRIMGPRDAAYLDLTDSGIEIPRTVPTGDVEFRITNAGTREHNLKIVGGGLEAESAVVEPGKSTTLQTTLTTSRFDTFCAVGDHTSKERNEVGVTITAAPAQ